MKKTEFSEVNEFLACENYVLLQNEESIDQFCEIANRLQISILVLDDKTISYRNKIQKSMKQDGIELLSPKMILEKLQHASYDLNQYVSGFKDVLASNDKKKIMLVSRATFRDTTINKLKKSLSSSRKEYEIICLESTDITILKWAAHDKRIDYLSLDIKNSNPVDSALCSLMKQNDKFFEIVLSPLLNSNNEKEFGTALRNGKKIMDKITTNNVPYILTLKPNTPFQLRASNQLRYLGELLGFPFRKTKDQVFYNQLKIIVNNTIKLNESHLFEGIREAV